REAERRAFARLRFHPDAASVPLRDLLADREADAGAWVLVAPVQPFEGREDPLRVLRIDADCVVLHREAPAFVGLLDADVHARGLLVAELQRVADEVLEELDELRRIGADLG